MTLAAAGYLTPWARQRKRSRGPDSLKHAEGYEMAKGQVQKKQVKKAPAKTLKEKRKDNAQKKATKGGAPGA